MSTTGQVSVSAFHRHQLSSPVGMDKEEQGYSRIAYYLAKSTTCYLEAVVAAESGKGPEQRQELSDNQIYAANIMLIIAVNKVSMVFQQNPSVVHLLALKEFWKGIYSYEQINSFQIEMNDKFNCLLENDKDILETIGNLFCGLGQNNDAKLLEELVGIYRQWHRADKAKVGMTKLT